MMRFFRRYLGFFKRGFVWDAPCAKPQIDDLHRLSLISVTILFLVQCVKILHEGIIKGHNNLIGLPLIAHVEMTL